MCRGRRASTPSSARALVCPPQSYPDYVDLRDRNRSFEAPAAYKMEQAVVDTGCENPSAAWLYEVSGNYFDALGIRP